MEDAGSRTPAHWSRQALEGRGFVGWHRFDELRSHLTSIDRAAGGVYLVYRGEVCEPEWLEHSPGGTWRGDPSVPIEDLVLNWVDGVNLVYVGKANTGQLRKRLRAYASFGEGGKGRHYGGRLIWQLADSERLLVAWRELAEPADDPYSTEQGLLREFRADFGCLPFANMIGG